MEHYEEIKNAYETSQRITLMLGALLQKESEALEENSRESQGTQSGAVLNKWEPEKLNWMNQRDREIAIKKHRDDLWQPVIFKPEMSWEYWYISGLGELAVTVYDGSPLDERNVLFNNCFEYRCEAEFELEKRKVIAELQSLSKKSFGRDTIDWTNKEQKKWSFLVDSFEIAPLKSTQAISAYICERQPLISDCCFKTAKDCLDAVRKVGHARIRVYIFGEYSPMALAQEF